MYFYCFISMFGYCSRLLEFNLSFFIYIIQAHAYCDDPDIILIGNKNDLEHLRVVSEVRARSIAEKYNLPYIETSAATGQNVRRSIDILLEMVMTR